MSGYTLDISNDNLDLDYVKREHCKYVYEYAGQDVGKAAKMLNITKQTLYNYLHNWDIRYKAAHYKLKDQLENNLPLTTQDNLLPCSKI